MNPRIAMLLTNLDRAYDSRSFHGTTLQGALRGLKVDMAMWKPGPKRNSIWELVLHAAYWKYIVRRYLVSDKSIKFSRSPRNFPHLPEDCTPATLKKDVQLLATEHGLLRDVVASFPAKQLNQPTTKTSPEPEGLILGIAAHDLYHTGQIQLLKRMFAEGLNR